MTGLTTSLALSLFASASPAQVLFKDVTATSGVTYHQNATDLSDMSAMCGGAAAGDVDGDGWVDLLVTRLDAGPLLFMNRGANAMGQHQGFVDGTLNAFGGATPPANLNGASMGDVDGDGDLDLMCTGLASPRGYLWINNGAGQFVEEGATRGLNSPGGLPRGAFSSSFGDYDRDGFLDLYVTEWGHFDGQGPPTTSGSRLFRNRGASAPGYFEDVTDAAGVALENVTPQSQGTSWTGVNSFTPKFADFDGDGWPDLAIAGDFSTSRLFWNNGDGTFLDGTAAAHVGRDENGMGAAVADFDGDGNLDWFVTSVYDPRETCFHVPCNWGATGNRLYLGDGARDFVNSTDTGVRNGRWGWAATQIDFDNDGQLDLAMTNGMDLLSTNLEDKFNHDPSVLWRNHGGSFVSEGLARGIHDRRSGKGIVVLDYDRDGDQDLFIVNARDLPVLYRNDGGNQAHWLQVELRGQGSNRFAIGAKLSLMPNLGDSPLVRYQSASSNFLSQNEPLVQFGLGADAVVHQLRVRWPDGSSTLLQNIPAGQRILVQQP